MENETSALNQLSNEAVGAITELGGTVSTIGLAVIGVAAAIVGVTVVLRLMKKH